MAKSQLVGIATEVHEEVLEKWMTLDDDDDVLPSQVKPRLPTNRFGHATTVEMVLLNKISVFNCL